MNPIDRLKSKLAKAKGESGSQGETNSSARTDAVATDPLPSTFGPKLFRPPRRWKRR